MFKVKTEEERIKDFLRCEREIDKVIDGPERFYPPWEDPPYNHRTGPEGRFQRPERWIPPSDGERFNLVESLIWDLSSRYEIIHNDTKLYNLILYIKREISVFCYFEEFGERDFSDFEDLLKWLMDQYLLLSQLCLGDPKSENYKRIYENLTRWVWDERPEEPYVNEFVRPYVENPSYEIPSRRWDSNSVWI